ncbi:Phosphotransferase enzyme family protein [Paramicrobacterium humi]|uniref:Phosphotransferase enzyme family protein n=1 Tax=Paramicrobacterium humi TaxID=640635 RepID=A0A1H4T8W7_9MICO|nr:phosphotransferase [Microbacterium humi]SEC52925.1 Phosphotransferase enzyme family protein [Microbacterium humi]
MARSPLTLAAVAASALPDTSFVGSGPLGHGESGEFDSALLLGDDQSQYVVRVPTTQQAETDQSRELLVLQSMSDGIRSRLPFDVHRVIGQAPVDGSRAVVYDYLYGYQVEAAAIPAGDGVAASIGGALAAIHGLPSSFVSEAGLPVQSASDCREEARNVIERAAATGMLPAAVKNRWLEAAADEALWRFLPTVINGSVAADSFLITDHEAGPIVTGVLGWGSLKVSDPAHDLHWLSAAGEAAESVFAGYVAASHRSPDALIRQRSLLYAELELARWLLHGRDTHDEAIVADAVSMLDGLVDSVLGNLMSPLSPATGPIMTVSDVQDMLDKNPTPPRAPSSAISMDTDSFDRSEFLSEWDKEANDETDVDEAPASQDDLATGPIDLSQLGSTEDSQRERSSSADDK